jgi:hypothetical protein
MYERVRQEIYELFARRGVHIEVNEAVDSPIFLCLKICYQPVRGITRIVGKFIDED